MSDSVIYNQDYLRSAKVSTLDNVRQMHVDDGKPFWVTCQVLFGSDGMLQTVCPLTCDGRFFTIRKVVNGAQVLAGFPDLKTQNTFEDLYFKITDLMKSGKIREALALVNKGGVDLNAGETGSEDTSSGSSQEDTGSN